MSEPTEPFAIPDTFCTDVTIEDLGNGIRGLVFSSPHFSDGRAYQRGEVRVIVPSACLPHIRQKLLPHAEKAIIEMIKHSDGHDPG